jgi:Leucine-rich repeat (LRR) protein
MDNYLQDLTGFPQSAPQLKTLNLDNNDLHSLIDLPTSLPALTALHLRNNRITTLRGIPKNAPLQILDLGENPKATLQQLPDGAFLTLKHLNVSNTSHYKDLHTELMPKLEFLDASHLDLSEVPRLHPNAAEQLTFLNLDHNVIRTLRDPTTQHSKFPDELPNLTSLHLHNNAIQSLEGLPQMPNLRVLGLRGNDLTDFRGLPHFAGKDYPYIMFDENPIRSFRGIPEEDFLSFMHENSDNPRSLPSPIRSNVKACHDALQTAVNTHLITTDDLKTMPIARAPDCQKVWAYHP